MLLGPMLRAAGGRYRRQNSRAKKLRVEQSGDGMMERFKKALTMSCKNFQAAQTSLLLRSFQSMLGPDYCRISADAAHSFCEGDEWSAFGSTLLYAPMLKAILILQFSTYILSVLVSFYLAGRLVLDV